MKKHRQTILFSLVLQVFLLITACTQSPRSAQSFSEDAANGSSLSQSEMQQGIQRITILHTNDMHGTYMPFQVTSGNATAQTGDKGNDTLLTFGKEGMVGGFTYLARAIMAIRNEKGANRVLLVDGGDTFGDNLLGNLTKGEAMIQLMNKAGYDFMALGNHDFDYGLERTRELQAIARFPMRAANITEEQTKQPIFGTPFHVFEKDGIKIGILALAYRNTPQTGNPENVKGLQFTDGLEAAREYVPELVKKADVVVVLSHEGTKVDELLAKEVPGIDLIIGAHSHDLLSPPKKVNQTHLVQALSDDAVLGQTELVLKGSALQDIKVQYHKLWNDKYQPDEATQILVHTLRAPFRATLEEEITESKAIIGRQYKSESPFDKLVGNLLLEAYKADVAMLPGVGYGISLQPGPVTREALYNLLPHPAKVATVSLTGRQILLTLEQSALNLKPASPLQAVGGLIQTAGIRYTMDLTRPAGHRISKAAIQGKALEKERLYKVITHTGMVSGIHNYNEIGKGQNIEKTNKKLHEFVVDKLKAREAIDTPPNMNEVELLK